MRALETRGLALVCVIVHVAEACVSSVIPAVPSGLRLQFLRAGHLAIVLAKADDAAVWTGHVYLGNIDPARGAPVVLWSTSVQGLWSMAAGIQVWIAIELVR